MTDLQASGTKRAHDEDDDDDVAPVPPAVVDVKPVIPRPAAPVGSDRGAVKPSSKRVATEDDEDDEDDDDEDDEDDEEDEAPRKKGGKKEYRNPFIDFEAEVDDDDEDDDDGDGDVPGLVGDDDEADEAEVAASRQQYRRALQQQQRKQDITDLDEAAIEKRYAELAMQYDDQEQDDTAYEVRGHVKQQALQPTIRDPKMYMVPCKRGIEEELVLAILSKFWATKGTSEAVGLHSACAPPHLLGAIYVEADSPLSVKNALRGLRGVMFYDASPVPITERVAVVSPPSREDSLKKDSFVRITRGAYKNDIAQVVRSDPARGTVICRIVPRIDIEELKRKKRGEVAVKGMKKIRPRAQLINEDDFKNANIEVGGGRDAETGDSYITIDSQKFIHGFLIKAMNIKSLSLEGVSPTLDDVQRFATHANEEEEEPLAGAVRPGVKLFDRGDVVRVKSGPLKNLMATIEKVQDDLAFVKANHPDIKDELALSVSDLEKHFKSGDHVKVLGGRYQSETGLIVRVDGHVAVLFSDLGHKEIKVLVSDCRLTTEVSTGQLQLGAYKLFDLITVDAMTVAMIVKIAGRDFHLLLANGNTQVVPHEQAGARRYSRAGVVTDARANALSPGDLVKVLEGPYSQATGQLKAVYRYFAWIQSREYMHENNGIIVCRANHIVLQGAQMRPMAAPVVRSTAPMNAPVTPVSSDSYVRQRTLTRVEPKTQAQKVFEKYQRSDSDALFKGKNVIVTQGRWKTYRGFCRETRGDKARVELQMTGKIESIPFEFLKVVSTARDENAARENNQLDRNNDVFSMPTPARLEDFPSTPGNATPSRSAWDPMAPTTPHRNADGLDIDDTDNDSHHGSSTYYRENEFSRAWGDSANSPGYPSSSQYGHPSNAAMPTPSASMGPPATPTSASASSSSSAMFKAPGGAHPFAGSAATPYAMPQLPVPTPSVGTPGVYQPYAAYTPHASANPMTPNAGGSFAPFTPGAASSSSPSVGSTGAPTPYSQPTPFSGSSFTPSTPGHFAPGTPNFQSGAGAAGAGGNSPHFSSSPAPFSPHVPFTPGFAQQPQTPFAQAPQTPFGAPSFNSPSFNSTAPFTPGMHGSSSPFTPNNNESYGWNPAQDEDAQTFQQPQRSSASRPAAAASWVRVGLEVQRRDEVGVVLSVSSSSAKVQWYKTQLSEDCDFDELRPCSPVKKDKVVVISGPQTGDEGSCMGLDGSLVILKMAGSDDIRMFEVVQLCKKAPE